LAPPLKNINGGEHKIKKSSMQRYRVSCSGKTVKLLKKYNGMNYYVPVQQDEVPSYKKQRDE